MKQATNPFAPVPLWRKRLPGYAAMGVATIALAVGLTTLQSARTTVAGTLLPVSEADAATYGISAVYQLDDGSYRVEGSQKGFQSDVQAAVTIDAEGNVSAVEILSQDETENLGGQCVNPEFTSQYQGAAPFTLAGKSYTVTDPVTGAAYAAAGAAEEQPAAAGDFDPAQWRTFDTSPEAEATRKMYAAGLTLSALNGQPLGDELAPPLDSSAEAVARRKLYAAMLSKSALDGEPMAIPFADLSAEEQSKMRLEQASLTTAGNASGAVSADLTEVDALSGATITSSAVTTIVNNSYFYVTGDSAQSDLNGGMEPMAKTDFLTADMTRRQFMKISGKSLAGLTLSASMLSLFGCSQKQVDSGAVATWALPQGLLVVNADLCTGCQRCEINCTLTNDGVCSSYISRVKIQRRLNLDGAGNGLLSGTDNCFVYFPDTCRQCEDPACGNACPQKAITTNEQGIRVVDTDKCIGCGACHDACPWHMPTVNPETGKSSKCIACGACVAGCPSGALSIVDWDAVTSAAQAAYLDL